MQRITRDVYKQLHTNKLDNLEKTDKFLETYNQPRLNHKKIENLNRPIMTREIESVVKNLPTKKIPELDGFTGEFYQMFKELMQILLKFFPKIEEEETSKHILWGQYYPCQMPEKDTTRKKIIGQYP